MSPDGNYYWDGQRWMPVAHSQPLQPAYVQQPIGVQPTPLVLYQPSTNGLAVASLVFGIISWLVCPIIGGIVAVVCGHVAHSQIKRTGESGSGLATAGLVLGYAHIAASAIAFFFWLILFGGMLALIGAIGAAAPTPTP